MKPVPSTKLSTVGLDHPADLDVWTYASYASSTTSSNSTITATVWSLAAPVIVYGLVTSVPSTVKVLTLNPVFGVTVTTVSVPTLISWEPAAGLIVPAPLKVEAVLSVTTTWYCSTTTGTSLNETSTLWSAVIEGMLNVNVLPPVCTSIPFNFQLFTSYPVLGVAVNVIFTGSFSLNVWAVDGLIEPFAPAEGVTVYVGVGGSSSNVAT